MCVRCACVFRLTQNGARESVRRSFQRGILSPFAVTRVASILMFRWETGEHEEFIVLQVAHIVYSLPSLPYFTTCVTVTSARILKPMKYTLNGRTYIAD